MNKYVEIKEAIADFELTYLTKMWDQNGRIEFNQNEVRVDLNNKFDKIINLVNNTFDNDLIKVVNNFLPVCKPITYIWDVDNVEHLNIWLETDLIPNIIKIIDKKLK